MTPTRALAEYAAHSKHDDFPSAAIEGAKLTILDTLGVGFAALDQPVARSILTYIRALGGAPDATVLGAGNYRTSLQLAAQANGCLVNILDFDGHWHIPTYVLPAVLAVGEKAGSSGAEVLEAYLTGLQVASRMRKTIDAKRAQHVGPTYRGWYHVSLYGPLAAALAAGKLLKLDADALQGAIGIAAGNSGGVRENLHTSAKSLASGNAAALGVQSALLAQQGVSGALDILEGRVGLVAALCQPGECDWTLINDGLGAPYEVATALGLKLFPSVGPTQLVILALQELRQATPFSAEEIESVEACLSLFSASGKMPESGLAGGFSWPYVLASTLVDGSFRVEHLSEAKLRNADIVRTAARIKFAPPTQPECVTIVLRDGRRLTAEIKGKRDELDLDMSSEQIQEKFRDCARRALAPDAVSSLEHQVMHLEQLGSMDQFALLLRGPRN